MFGKIIGKYEVIFKPRALKTQRSIDYPHLLSKSNASYMNCPVSESVKKNAKNARSNQWSL